MAKSGQARILSSNQQKQLFEAIQQHRHPEKNTAIFHISFKLGLRAQEISLLQIKEVAQLSKSGAELKILEVMSLPASYTKGANALRRSKTRYQRRNISFDVDSFNKLVYQIAKLVKSGAPVDPKTFYPTLKKHHGKTRDLPIVDKALRSSLEAYLNLNYRMSMEGNLKPSSPLFITQKGGPYSPNTLPEHMALILRQWAGVEKATSHRRSLITNIIHKQKNRLKWRKR